MVFPADDSGNPLTKVNTDARRRVRTEGKTIVGKREPDSDSGPPPVITCDVGSVDICQRGLKSLPAIGGYEQPIIGECDTIPARPCSQRPPHCGKASVEAVWEELCHLATLQLSTGRQAGSTASVTPFVGDLANPISDERNFADHLSEATRVEDEDLHVGLGDNLGFALIDRIQQGHLTTEVAVG